MKEIKTIKFPGDTEPREIVDAKMREEIFSKTNISLSEYTTINYAINTSHIWSNKGQSIFVPVADLNSDEIIVTANSSYLAVVCFLKTNEYSFNGEVIYAEGTGRNVVPVGTTQIFSIPSDCNYINILTIWEYDYTPEKIEVNKSIISELNSDVETVREDIESTRELFTKTGIIAYSEFLLSEYPSLGVGISEGGLWKTAGNSKFIPASEIIDGKITITANKENGSTISLLKSNSHVVNEAAEFAEGTVRTYLQPGTIRTFTIPSDCTHINILTTWTNDYTPAKIEANKNTISKKDENIVEGDVIGLTVDNWTDSACISSTRYVSGVLKQGEVMSAASGNLKASDFVELHNEMLEMPIPVVTDTTYGNYGYCLYDKDYNPIIGRCGSVIPNRSDDNYVVWQRIYIPSNAKYFRTTYWVDSFVTDGHAPEFTYNLISIPDEYKPITHELPVDTYMQNAIRRSRQLTDIKWTPRVNIPRYSMINGSTLHFLDWFYADKEYVGIPYSGSGGAEHSENGLSWTDLKEWGYSHNWVGQHIPFEAFVTAARYPNSIFSETVNKANEDYDSSPFGIVCTALVNYAVDGPTPLRGIYNFFVTDDKLYRAANGYISDMDVNDIMIGDFLYTRAHVIIITDIMRDTNGNVTHVEMSEATTVGNGNNSVLGTKLGGVARRKMWEAQNFKNLYGAYKLYRRVTFYGIPYEPSNYVDTGNEGDRQNIVDYPCIPYLGNTAVYKFGYIPNSKICIGATGFTSLVVTKDGEPFGTFDITGLTEIDVGFSEVGQYEAYLTRIIDETEVKTIACKWSVVN